MVKFCSAESELTDSGEQKGNCQTKSKLLHIIVGDLTYERPNCYFELGYARAIRKPFEIVLCSRHDHIDHSKYQPRNFVYEAPLTFYLSLKPKYAPPKVHFDLAGFDAVTWDLDRLDDFKKTFEKRLQERLGYIREHKQITAATGTSPQPSQGSSGTNLEKIANIMRSQAEKTWK